MFIPTVGVCYKFTFIPGYTKLDKVYHVAQILTFEEFMHTNISLVETFYERTDKSIDDYNNDLSQIRDSRIVKLLDPETRSENTVVYAPMLYFLHQPDHNVKKYYSIVVGLNLGLHDNPEQLSYITNALSDQFKTAVGIESTPELFEINTSWMTPDEYALIEEERKQNTTKVLNYFSEVIRLGKEVESLKSRIAAYEEIITKNIPANTGG